MMEHRWLKSSVLLFKNIIILEHITMILFYKLIKPLCGKKYIYSCYTDNNIEYCVREKEKDRDTTPKNL